ncbi:MAG: signal recognition particle-docking protein FtsY [Candidatus Thermoplasmatota archaeon]|nr:signal recognition particle-docking protein FtsY [Candidatus Thermoplasmatota archaeon]
MFEALKRLFRGASDEVLTGSVRREDLPSRVREILLEADVAFDVAEKVSENFSSYLAKVKRKTAIDEVRDSLKAAMGDILKENPPGVDILKPTKKPYVILFIGINGTGKTTTVAKIAELLKKEGKRSVVAASDTFRAGAIEQISILCEEIGVPVIRHSAGSDPSSVAFDAIEHANARKLDYVLIDSAGRMQTNKNLLDEMKKMRRVAKPDATILVLDSMVGQDAVFQADTFLKEIEFDGVILTKLDTDAKGGAIISISSLLKKPILFVGVGQGVDDLLQFTPQWFIDRVFG